MPDMKAKQLNSWILDRSPLPDPAPTREKAIAALEALLAEYRAGRGDVGSRMTPLMEPGGAPRSFVDTAILLMLGEDALPKTRFNGGSVYVMDRREYAALATIGEGSAEAGTAVVVDAALEWALRDREGMIEWCKGTIPTLKDQGAIDELAAVGLLKSRGWNIPVQHPTWWGDLRDIMEEAGRTGSDDIVRAMALSWRKAPWKIKAVAA